MLMGGGFGRQSNYQDRIDIPGVSRFLHGLGGGGGDFALCMRFCAQCDGMALGDRDGCMILLLSGSMGREN